MNKGTRDKHTYTSSNRKRYGKENLISFSTGLWAPLSVSHDSFLFPHVVSFLCEDELNIILL